MGLSSAGYSIQTIDEIVTEINAEIALQISPLVDTTPESAIGLLVGIFAEREARAQATSRDVWQAFTPGGASGISLAQLCLLTGTRKRAATKSVVTCAVNLDAGVTLSALSQAVVSGDPAAAFELITAVTNSGGSPANVSATFRALTTGPIRANAGTLTTINTPTLGWNSVTNPADATLGLVAETDPQLLRRREQELRIQGAAGVLAVVADVLALADTFGVSVDAVGFENDSDITVGVLPPHSFRVVVWTPPGALTADQIAQAIWGAKTGGIPSVGSRSGVALDALGARHTVPFDLAAEEDVYMSVAVTVDPVVWPPADTAGRTRLDGLLKDALVSFAQGAWHIGSPGIVAQLYGPIFAIPGVVNITSLYLGLAPSPSTPGDLVFAADEKAIADTARIAIVVSP